VSIRDLEQSLRHKAPVQRITWRASDFHERLAIEMAGKMERIAGSLGDFRRVERVPGFGPRLALIAARLLARHAAPGCGCDRNMLRRKGLCWPGDFSRRAKCAHAGMNLPGGSANPAGKRGEDVDQ
jgi:hypothetical protein